jgi:hypothetical protein
MNPVIPKYGPHEAQPLRNALVAPVKPCPKQGKRSVPFNSAGLSQAAEMEGNEHYSGGFPHPTRYPDTRE